MPKNKLSIDLNVELTEKQRQRLHKAIHKTISAHLKKTETASVKKERKTARSLTADNVMKVNLDASFTNTNPGLSELKAILNDEEKTITESGKISFDKVQSGDIIIIQGESLGKTTVTIDVSAEPIQFNFEPGNFNGNFFID